MSFFTELKRRNVFRVAAAYIVLSWVLLQVGDVLFDTLELGGAWSKGLFALLMLGFVPTVVFSWAYELTPDGLRREGDASSDPATNARTGQRLNYITIGMVILGIAVALGDGLVRESSNDEPAADPSMVAYSNPSIAVLPFDDLSPDGDQRYFAHGIAEELLNVLAKVDGLEVASRTSSFQFADLDASLPEIADQLSVQHVLEGSVRKAGDTLRITAQLIDAQSDRHLWSETYDRPLTAENVFRVQDEIANAIVDRLADQLGARPPVAVDVTTEDLDAYELYLAARTLYLNRDRLDDADAMLARAVELDPEFAEAWSIRAATHVLFDEYDYVSEEERNRIDARAREFADRALALDPDNALALASMALMRRYNSWTYGEKTDYAQVLADFNRALAIDPRNGSALNWRGLTHAALGDLDNAEADFTRCLDVEPYYTPCEHNLQFSMAANGREAQALERFDAALDKGIPRVYSPYLPMFARAGEERAFKIISNRANLLTGWRRHDEYYQALRNPDKDHSNLLADLSNFVEERGLSTRDKAILLAPLGGGSNAATVIFVWDRGLARYRKTEAFKSAVRQSGVLDYWRTYGFPDRCRPLGNDDFECE